MMPRRAVAEMVAGLYDASLDAYLPHRWMESFNVFRRESSRVQAQFENRMQAFQQILYGWHTESKEARLAYRAFPNEISRNLLGYGFVAAGRDGYGAPGGPPRLKATAPQAGAPRHRGTSVAALGAGVAAPAPVPSPAEQSMAESKRSDDEGGGEGEESPRPDLSKVSARKNLNETAFFFPHLLAGANGVVKIEFTMPEALTEWKFMGFAHDRELRSGFLTDKAVTAKDLMVEPNPPRFVREGDTIEFAAKVTNQTDARQNGLVKLTLADARTLKTVDVELANNLMEQPFDIPAKESRSFAWRLTVPDGMDFLTYKVVGATNQLSDGEEGYLPVLSRRILVSESLPSARARQADEDV